MPKLKIFTGYGQIAGKQRKLAMASTSAAKVVEAINASPNVGYVTVGHIRGSWSNTNSHEPTNEATLSKPGVLLVSLKDWPSAASDWIPVEEFLK